MSMRWFTGILIVLLLIGGSSCSRDPEVVKRKYVENGNKYYQRGKYKEASIMYRSALKKDLRYAEAYYRLGLTDLRLDDRTGAAGAFRRAVSLWDDEKKTGPQVDDARTKLADLYLGHYLGAPRKPKVLKDEIAGLADQLAKSDPKSFDAFRLKGFLAWLDGDKKKAIELFRAANDRKPNNPDLVLALSQVLDADGQPAEAEKLAKSLVEKEKSFAPIYDVLYGLYARQKRIQDAENVLKLKIANNPKQIYYVMQLARHYLIVRQREDCERVLRDALSRPQDYPTAGYQVGDFYRSIRDYGKALQVYRDSLKGEPADKLRYMRSIAETLAAQGNRDEASKMVAEILKEHPKDDQALALRATLLLDSGNRGELQTAITDLQASVTRMPKNAVVRYNLGRAYFAKGDMEQAGAQFTEAVNLRPDYLAPRLWLGQIELLKGEFAKSLQTANESLAVNPGNLEARLLRALSLRSMGNYDQARAELAALVESNPNSVDAAFQLGLLDYSQKNFKKAEEIFQKCQSMSSSDLRCLTGLSETYMAQKHYDRAIQVLEEAHQAMPGRREISLSVANAAVLAGKYELAVKRYGELLAKNPNSGDLEVRLGEVYRRMGDKDSAVSHFRRAKELEPQDPRAYIPLALMLDGLGRRSEARTLYEQVLKLQPDNAVVLNNLAYVMAETGGDLDQALTYAQRAKQKLPQDPNVSDTLGWIYIKKNLSDNAIQIYRDLIARSPGNPTFRFHLGMALFQKGDKIGARKELDAALRNSPSKEEAGKIRDLMTRIG